MVRGAASTVPVRGPVPVRSEDSTLYLARLYLAHPSDIRASKTKLHPVDGTAVDTSPLSAQVTRGPGIGRRCVRVSPCEPLSLHGQRAAEAPS